MICECQQLSKKRTLLDGIKSIAGTLIIFKLEKSDGDDLYMKRCCFLTLIPSLYTFVDKSWLTYANTVVYDPSVNQAFQEDIDVLGSSLLVFAAFKIKQTTLQRLVLLGDELSVVYINSARLIAHEYEKVMNSLNSAHRRISSLEQSTTDLKFKYLSTIHRNTTDKNFENKQDDKGKQQDGCGKCNNINDVRITLKELKQQSYENINKTHYELEVSKKNIIELQREVAYLKEENAKLNEINKSLYMNR